MDSNSNSNSDSDAASIATVDHELLYTVEHLGKFLNDTIEQVGTLMEKAQTWGTTSASQKVPLKVTLATDSTAAATAVAAGLPAGSTDFESFISTITKYTLDTLAAGGGPAETIRESISTAGGWFAFLHSLTGT